MTKDVVPSRVVAEWEALHELLTPLVASMPAAGFEAYCYYISRRAADIRQDGEGETDEQRAFIMQRCAERLDAFLERARGARGPSPGF